MATTKETNETKKAPAKKTGTSTTKKAAGTKSSTAKTASKSTAKKTETSGSSDKTVVMNEPLKASASKSTSAKATPNSGRKTGSRKKKNQAPKWFTVLVFIAVAIYAGWYIYTNREELLDAVFAQETVATETAQSSTSANTVKTEKPAPAAKKIVAGENGYSFEGDLGYAENNPLFFGNPSDAVADLNANTNYLMIKDQYTLSYNDELLIPNWAAWHLQKSDIGKADRSDDFRADTDLPSGWYQVKKADYQYSTYGYDRGHVCPSADRTATKNDNSMTFLMTNMVPQTPDNNRIIWMHFENFERELVNQGNEVYIIAGPYGKGGTSQKGTFEEIPIKQKKGETLYMRVPSHTWKVVIAIPEGENDMARVTQNATVIAINVPNEMGIAKNGDWEQYICSIDDIEEMTGYDFFELLPDDVESVLEAAIYQPAK